MVMKQISHRSTGEKLHWMAILNWKMMTNPRRFWFGSSFLDKPTEGDDGFVGQGCSVDRANGSIQLVLDSARRRIKKKHCESKPGGDGGTTVFLYDSVHFYITLW